jgi:hypothetical protein
LLLPAGYQPDPNSPPGGNYTPVSANSPIYTDLMNAFTAAPKRLQRRLCTVTVFIDQTACSSASCANGISWGFRNPTDTSQRYIALSQGLWGGGQSAAFQYSTYETAAIGQILTRLQAPWPTTATPPGPQFLPATYISNSGVATSVNTSAMTVLAALAHEYGHIVWYDLIKGSDQNYVPGTFCRANPKVPGDGFFDGSWTSVTPPNSFQGFAETTNDAHAAGIQVANLVSAIQGQQWSTAAADLNAIYSSDASNPTGIWPGLFGFVSPEEDFVDSFKIFVMTRPETNGGMPVNWMPLQIFSDTGPQPAYTPDIYSLLAHAKKKVLKRKLDCIDNKWPQQ